MIIDGRQFEKVNDIYTSKKDAQQDAIEYRSTGRYYARVIQPGSGYKLYIARKEDDNGKRNTSRT